MVDKWVMSPMYPIYKVKTHLLTIYIHLLYNFLGHPSTPDPFKKSSQNLIKSTSSWAKHAEASIWSSFSLLPTSQPAICLGCGGFTHPPKKKDSRVFFSKKNGGWVGSWVGCYFFWRFLSFKGFWEKETQQKSVAAFSNHGERKCGIFPNVEFPNFLCYIDIHGSLTYISYHIFLPLHIWCYLFLKDFCVFTKPLSFLDLTGLIIWNRINGNSLNFMTRQAATPLTYPLKIYGFCFAGLSYGKPTPFIRPDHKVRSTTFTPTCFC